MMVTFKRTIRIFICTLFLFGIKTAGAADFLELSLDELLEIKITTASKKAETIYEAPSVVSVITRADLENTGARTLKDALELIPGVEGHRGVNMGTHNSVAIRGRITDSAEDVLLLVNGQRVNSLYTGGGWQTIKQMPVGNIKQIEIIRGPGSALYGSNAFVGVVNVKTFTTADLTEDSNGEVEVFGGSLNYNGANVRMGKEAGDLKVMAYAGYAEDDGDEYKLTQGWFRFPGMSYEVEDPMKTLDLSLNLTYASLYFDIDYSDRDSEGYLPAGFLSPNTPVAGLDKNEDNSNFLRSQLKYEWKMTDEIIITPAVRFSKGHLDGEFYLAPAMVVAMAPQFAPLVGTSASTQGWYGGPDYDEQNLEYELQFNYEGENHSFVGGIYYQEEEMIDPVSKYSVFPTFLIPPGSAQPAVADNGVVLADYEGAFAWMPEAERDVLGIYLQDTWRITEDLSWLVGVRYDDYSDFGDTLNPRTAVVYQFSDKMNMKFLYGSAFRAPTANELYIRLNPVENGNANLDPQTIDTYEVNFNFLPTRELKASLTFFFTEYQDLIGLQLDPNLPAEAQVPQYQNATGDEEDTGMEFEIKYQSTKYRYVSANIAYIKAEDANGDQRVNVAQQKAALVVNYDIMENKLIFNASAFFRGDRENIVDASGNALQQEIDDEIIVNANVRVLDLFGKEGLEWSLGASNLTDDDYTAPGQSSNLTPQNLPQRGLQVTTHLKMKY